MAPSSRRVKLDSGSGVARKSSEDEDEEDEDDFRRWR